MTKPPINSPANPPPPPGNAFALWSLVFGILGLAFEFLFLPGMCAALGMLLLAPLACVLGIVGLLMRGRKLMAITGLAAGLIPVALLCGVYQRDATPRVTAARTAATKAHLADLQKALSAFHADLGRYPTTAEGLDALIHAPAGTDTQWHGPYADKTFKSYPDANEALDTWTADAWLHPLFYQYPGTVHPDTYDLISAGWDGNLHTSDDITSP